MLQKAKDVVMTIGSKVAQRIKRERHSVRNKCRDLSISCKQISQNAIEGEYLGKGGLIVAGSASLTFAGNALAIAPEDVTPTLHQLPPMWHRGRCRDTGSYQH